MAVGLCHNRPISAQQVGEYGGIRAHLAVCTPRQYNSQIAIGIAAGGGCQQGH
jgi:hypothetical protein